MRIGETAKLELAIQDKRIFEAPEDDLNSCLRYCFMVVGLRGQNLPSDLERIFLVNFIREHYGGHTAAEIRLAFDMAVTGKLEVDPVCYENFSVIYFSGIMNAFRKWSVPQVWKIQTPEPKKPTADEILQINIEYAFYMLSKVNKLPVKV